MDEGQQEIIEALRDCGPFGIAERIKRAGGGVEQPREHVGKPAGCDDARLAETRLAAEAPMQRL